MPGGNVDPARVEAEKAAQKDRERRSTMYGIFRTFFEVQCISLNIHEVAVLEYGLGGIMPKVERQEFPEEESDRRAGFMEERMADFHMMSKNGDVSLVQEALAFIKAEIKETEDMLARIDKANEPVSPLLGPDGQPMKKAATDVEEETTDEETAGGGDSAVDEALQEVPKQE